MPTYEHSEEVFPAQEAARRSAHSRICSGGMPEDEEQFRYLAFKQFLFGYPLFKYREYPFIKMQVE